jgi:DNA helicase-2/ATP-dependent DNA helicase PcrA
MVNHVIDAPIEQSIIVHAGPGAGKTYLIAQRIAYLLKSGLRKNSRIACITYTNTGVDEVMDELIPTHFNHLPSEIYLNTIHSFLLEHILKPYSHFLPEIPSNFKLTPPNGFARRYPIFEMRTMSESKLKAFESIYYDVKGNYVCYRPVHIGKTSSKPWEPTQAQMSKFKNSMHREGYIDLPDVLWFSLKLLRSYPFITEALACRFQTIVVDEFQDTTDLQVEILNILHATGKTSFFIVGDPNQSIFSYAGSRPSLFANYCQDHKFLCLSCNEIAHPFRINRRSSESILRFLNKYSTIPEGQIPGEQEWANDNSDVLLIVGGINRIVNIERFRLMTLKHFFELMDGKGIDRNQNDSFGVFAYENKTVAILNQISQDESVIVRSNKYDQIKQANKPLYRFINGLLTAIKHKQFGEWSDAYSRVNDVLTYHFYGTSPLFCKYDNIEIGLNRQVWGVAIWKIMQGLSDNKDLSIYVWLQGVKVLISNSIILVGGRKSKKLGMLDCRASVKKPATLCTVNDALLSIVRPRLHIENFRTIHGAKGTQRDAVLIYACDAEELTSWLLCENIDQSEKARIGYVGFSRAKKILCIACESITEAQHLQIKQKQLPLRIIELNEQPQLF